MSIRMHVFPVVSVCRVGLIDILVVVHSFVSWTRAGKGVDSIE